MSWEGFRKGFGRFIRALTKGELLLSIGAHKYYVHVLYLFLLAWLSILLNLKVDRTLTRVEANKVELHDLEIYHAEKEAELVRLHSASMAAGRLKQLGSEVKLPEQPAIRIDR